MAVPVTRVYVDFGLGSPTEITSQVHRIAIRRGRNRITSKFEPGSMDVILYDETGNWNPANTSGAYYPNLTPLRKIYVTATHNSVTYTLFTGYISDYITNFSTGVEEFSNVTLRCVDAFKMMATSSITTVTGGVAGQLSGARVDDILDAAQWSASLRSIDTGNSTLQADPGTLRTALDALQTVENSEGGGIFVDNLGNITFIDRHSLIGKFNSILYGFSDNGSTPYDYQQAAVVYDDTTLLNQITVTRQGGSPQVVSDAASIASYFVHSGVREGILLQSDTETNDLARSILATRKDPEVRIDSLTINLYKPSDSQVAALDIELLDAISIQKTTPGSTSVGQSLLVHAIHHDITRTSFLSTFYTSEPLIRGFILDSQASGKLDFDVLSY